jgi:hypothetical protein
MPIDLHVSDHKQFAIASKDNLMMDLNVFHVVIDKLSIHPTESNVLLPHHVTVVTFSLELVMLQIAMLAEPVIFLTLFH